VRLIPALRAGIRSALFERNRGQTAILLPTSVRFLALYPFSLLALLPVCQPSVCRPCLCPFYRLCLPLCASFVVISQCRGNLCARVSINFSNGLLSSDYSLSHISCYDTFNGSLIYLALQLRDLLLVRMFAIERCPVCRVLKDLRHENVPLTALHVDQSNLESNTDSLLELLN